MFDKLLIANRGEIAVRIARTCRELGIRPVAVCSDPDAGALHATFADEVVALPGAAPSDTYASIPALVAAARASGASAVHPGYGFVAESAAFARAVQAEGLVWVGPPPEALAAAGDKIRARTIASRAGVAVVPGLTEAVSSVEQVTTWAHANGYPVALKAAGGGGGRGLKVARAAEEVGPALEAARREAEAYFGSADVYVEGYLVEPRHYEVQVLAPVPGDARALGVRDCSLQRRHQKLVEETPPALSAPLEAMETAAVTVARACGYVGAGTVEMLVDAAGDFYFLEINARLQVEHTVTEEVFGIDLVASQIRIAAREALDAAVVPRGHAIEARINAEDPRRGFAPVPGVLQRYVEPGGPGVRVDSGYREGHSVPGQYDSLIAKLVVWAPTRARALRRMVRALDEFTIAGVPTTIPALRLLIESEEFASGRHTTRTVEESDVLASLTEESAGVSGEATARGLASGLWSPALAGAELAMTGRAEAGQVMAPISGTVLEVHVEPGDTVEAGAPLAVIEAMKMQTTVEAPCGGIVADMGVVAGEVVSAGRLVARIE
jgi:acetyl-CoA/propionyl-CoA carboxylase, biotin carboxylase, biotin carboxyl carrier protein